MYTHLELPTAGGASSTPALGTNFGILVHDPRTAVSRQTLDSFEAKVCGGAYPVRCDEMSRGREDFFPWHGLTWVQRTTKWSVSHCDAGLPHVRHGCVALRHGLVARAARVCRTATRACRTCGAGVSHCDTGLSHVRRGCVTLRHGLVARAARVCHAATPAGERTSRPLVSAAKAHLAVRPRL